jgi:hypothetical protein
LVELLLTPPERWSPWGVGWRSPRPFTAGSAATMGIRGSSAGHLRGVWRLPDYGGLRLHLGYGGSGADSLPAGARDQRHPPLGGTPLARPSCSRVSCKWPSPSASAPGGSYASTRLIASGATPPDPPARHDKGPGTRHGQDPLHLPAEKIGRSPRYPYPQHGRENLPLRLRYGCRYPPQSLNLIKPPLPNDVQLVAQVGRDLGRGC